MNEVGLVSMVYKPWLEPMQCTLARFRSPHNGRRECSIRQYDVVNKLGVKSRNHVDDAGHEVLVDTFWPALNVVAAVAHGACSVYDSMSDFESGRSNIDLPLPEPRQGIHQSTNSTEATSGRSSNTPEATVCDWS